MFLINMQVFLTKNDWSKVTIQKQRYLAKVQKAESVSLVLDSKKVVKNTVYF